MSWGRHFGEKISLSVSRDRAYLARVAWRRFLSLVRILEKATVRPARLDPGAGEFSLVAELARRNPDGGQGAVVEQGAQPVGVEFVRLMHVAHHHFGLGGVRQMGHTSGRFDLVDDPYQFPPFRGRPGSRVETGRGRSGRRLVRGRPGFAGRPCRVGRARRKENSACARHNRSYNGVALTCCTFCALVRLATTV